MDVDLCASTVQQHLKHTMDNETIMAEMNCSNNDQYCCELQIVSNKIVFAMEISDQFSRCR